MGVRRIVRVKGESGYVASFVDDLVGVDGLTNWREVSGDGYG